MPNLMDGILGLPDNVPVHEIDMKVAAGLTPAMLSKKAEGPRVAKEAPTAGDDEVLPNRQKLLKKATGCFTLWFGCLVLESVGEVMVKFSG